MYELICPSCGHVSSLPFVRVGASVACPRCRTRFLIGAEHVKRSTAARGPAPTARPVPAADDPPRVDEAGQAIGLSGLSEMMRREAQRPGPGKPPQTAATGPGAAPSPPRHPIVPFSEGMSPSTRLMILLLMGVIAVLAVSGVLVWYNAQERNNLPPNPAAPTPVTQQP